MMRFKHLFSTVIVVLFAVVLAACSHHTLVESKKDSTGYTPDPATEYLMTQYADATGVQGTFYTITNDTTLIIIDGGWADNASAVKTAKEALEDKLFEMNKGDTAALDMQAAKKAIEEAKANIEKLTKDADAQEVTAKVGGTIASVTVTAGDTASADTAIATINQTDRGFTVKISITNEQAKKVKVGDTAELVNYWGDATATLETIGNDPQNPQKNRQLTFRLTGSDIQPDSNITLAIGQQSASYDAIVPTSAIRTDNNGSFVLAIVSKSTPLSTRYTATRVDVQVLASDDKSSAVSGIGSGEFVITTSTKPIEAGTQVRLAENG